jgi:hypothetical protein
MLVLASVKWKFLLPNRQMNNAWNTGELSMRRTKSDLLLPTRFNLCNCCSSSLDNALCRVAESSVFRASTQLTALLIPTKSTHASKRPAGKIFLSRLVAHERFIDQSSAHSMQLSGEQTIIPFSHPNLFVKVDPARDAEAEKVSKLSTSHFEHKKLSLRLGDFVSAHNT